MEHQRWFIGQKLLQALEDKGYTQSSFAEMINSSLDGTHISQGTISNIISNKQRAKGKHIRLFAEKLGIQVEKLLDEEQQNSMVFKIQNQHGSANGNYNTINNTDLNRIDKMEQQISMLADQVQSLHLKLEKLVGLLEEKMGS